jgi:hypothetical protein
MPALFVSHASKDDAAASALEAWLLAKGFTDIFVDHHSIASGDRWRDESRASASACRVVVCLVTQSWLDAHECFAEFRAISGYWGKRTIPLFLLPPASSLSEEARRRLSRFARRIRESTWRLPSARTEASISNPTRRLQIV